jgi:hypothetical protein
VLLAWPKAEAALARTAGTHVVLVDGALTAYLTRDAKEVAVFLPETEPGRSASARAAARALAAWCGRTGRATLGWGGARRHELAPLAPFLLREGFEASGPGFRYTGEKARATRGTRELSQEAQGTP